MGAHDRRIPAEQRDPAELFGSPEALLASEDLALEDKIALLERWRFDEERRSASAYEGMEALAGDDESCLWRVERCLHALREETGPRALPPAGRRIP